ncbi:MAG: hypothetical protein DIU71_05690 [Proteobacteria bacterium]|nr:MAG: hypothetical protein DIU71_05690 [Pseudomonadota bacterium]
MQPKVSAMEPPQDPTTSGPSSDWGRTGDTPPPSRSAQRTREGTGHKERTREAGREQKQGAREAGSEPMERTREAVGERVERARETGGEHMERAREFGKERLEAGKSAASERTSALAGAIGEAGAELGRQGEQRLGTYAADLAATLDRLAGKLRHRSVDDFTTEVQELARRNPALFLAGSVGIGFAVARLLKASASRAHDADTREAQLGGRGTLSEGREEPHDVGTGTETTGLSPSAFAQPDGPQTATLESPGSSPTQER